MYDQDLPSVIESSGKSRDEHKITFYRLSTGWYFTELEDEDGEVFSLEEINRDQKNFVKATGFGNDVDNTVSLVPGTRVANMLLSVLHYNGMRTPKVENSGHFYSAV